MSKNEYNNIIIIPNEKYSPECVPQDNYDSFIREVAKSVTDGTLPDGSFGVLEIKDGSKSGTWVPNESVTCEHPHYREDVEGDIPDVKPEYELSAEQFASVVAWIATGRLRQYLMAVNKSVYGRERRTFGGAGRGLKNIGSRTVASDADEAASVKEVLHGKWSGDNAVFTAHMKGDANPSDFFMHGED